MIKINGVIAKDIDGNNLKDKDGSDLLLGKAVSRGITNPADGGGDSMRVYEMAQKINQCEDFEMSTSDNDFLKKVIEASPFLSVAIKGQMKLILTKES